MITPSQENKFFKQWGMTDAQVSDKEGIDMDERNFLSKAIALGYIWFEKRGVWLNKTNEEYTEDDIAILNELIETNE